MYMKRASSVAGVWAELSSSADAFFAHSSVAKYEVDTVESLGREHISGVPDRSLTRTGWFMRF